MFAKEKLAENAPARQHNKQSRLEPITLFVTYLVRHNRECSGEAIRSGIPAYQGETGHRLFRRDVAYLNR